MRTWVGVALGLLLIAAPPASAADVTYDGGGMHLTGGAEASRLTVTYVPNTTATVHDDAGTLRSGLGCLGTTTDATCGPVPLLGPQCLPCTASIDLGDGNDTLALTGQSQKAPFLVYAGAGDDDVHIAGTTNAIVFGGPGRDVLRADAISELDGGEGPDVVEGERAFATYAGRAAGVTVTLDGAAN